MNGFESLAIINSISIVLIIVIMAKDWRDNNEK